MAKEVTRCLLGDGALQLKTEGCSLSYLITPRIMKTEHIRVEILVCILDVIARKNFSLIFFQFAWCH